MQMCGEAEQRKAALRSEWGSVSSRAAWMGKDLCVQFIFEYKLDGLTRFKRSKALPVWENYMMSEMFDMLSLKEPLDSIIMEVFNSLTQPSLLLPAQTQFCKSFLWQICRCQNGLLHRQTTWMACILPEEFVWSCVLCFWASEASPK